jgi:hypothetical protein
MISTDVSQICHKDVDASLRISADARDSGVAADPVN